MKGTYCTWTRKKVSIDTIIPNVPWDQIPKFPIGSKICNDPFFPFWIVANAYFIGDKRSISKWNRPNTFCTRKEYNYIYLIELISIQFFTFKGRLLNVCHIALNLENVWKHFPSLPETFLLMWSGLSCGKNGNRLRLNLASTVENV